MNEEKDDLGDAIAGLLEHCRDCTGRILIPNGCESFGCRKLGAIAFRGPWDLGTWTILYGKKAEELLEMYPSNPPRWS